MDLYNPAGFSAFQYNTTVKRRIIIVIAVFGFSAFQYNTTVKLQAA